MYMGQPGDSRNGQETSVTATNVSPNQSQGHGSRPGAIVPINDVVPSDDFPRQAHNLGIGFNIDSPFSGSFGNSVPQFYCNTGPGSSQFPGSGWQTMPTENLSSTIGTTRINTTGHPNANAGYYMVGSAEYYTPNESYNTHNYAMWEFSAVIRAFSGA
jgi:hypothetical protein